MRLCAAAAQSDSVLGICYFIFSPICSPPLYICKKMREREEWRTGHVLRDPSLCFYVNPVNISSFSSIFILLFTPNNFILLQMCPKDLVFSFPPPPHSPRTSTFSEIKECQKRFMVESHTEDDDDAILTFNDWVLEPETKTEKMVVSFFFLSTKWWYLMCHGSCVTWNFMVTHSKCLFL